MEALLKREMRVSISTCPEEYLALRERIARSKRVFPFVEGMTFSKVGLKSSSDISTPLPNAFFNSTSSVSLSRTTIGVLDESISKRGDVYRDPFSPTRNSSLSLLVSMRFSILTASILTVPFPGCA